MVSPRSPDVEGGKGGGDRLVGEGYRGLGARIVEALGKVRKIDMFA